MSVITGRTGAEERDARTAMKPRTSESCIIHDGGSRGREVEALTIIVLSRQIRMGIRIGTPSIVDRDVARLHNDELTAHYTNSRAPLDRKWVAVIEILMRYETRRQPWYAFTFVWVL